MAIKVMVPGSCGELVQGTIGDVDFHITCPIDMFSEATAKVERAGRVVVADGLDKTAEAVRLTIERSGIAAGMNIDIESALPHGKGMASSTADIAAAVTATRLALGQAVSTEELAQIALSIEPTDGIFFDGIVIYDHRKGLRFETIGAAPPLDILVLEPPEEVDTVVFNKNKQSADSADEHMIAEALDMAVTAIKSWDIRLLGEAASMSALLNQTQLMKPVLPDVIDICRRKGGVGVNVAHSGSVMGMLAEAGYGQRLFERVSHLIPRAWNAYLVRLIDGGVRYADDRAFIVTA
ncbi:MAG: GHMP kinase [Actinomycetota bacterium]|nr:GHMP kinase [Actinomycetota bacterium]